MLTNIHFGYHVEIVPDGTSLESALNLKGKENWRVTAVYPVAGGKEVVYEKLLGEGIACEPEMG